MSPRPLPAFARALLFFVLFGLLAAAWIVPLRKLWEHGERAPIQLAMQAGTALTLLVATWIACRIERRPPTAAGLGVGRAAPHLALGLAIGAAWLGAALALAGLAGWIERLPFGPDAARLWLALAAVALNVLAQQLLLAGYVYEVLREGLGAVAAMLVSAALFSAYHAAAFHGAWLPPVNVFLAGLVFLLARERTGRIWLGAGIHVAWNGLLGPVLGLTVSGRAELGAGWSALRLRGPAAWTGGSFGLEGGLLVTLVTAALAVLLALAPGLPRLGGAPGGTAGSVPEPARGVPGVR